MVWTYQDLVYEKGWAEGIWQEEQRRHNLRKDSLPQIHVGSLNYHQCQSLKIMDHYNSQAKSRTSSRFQLCLPQRGHEVKKEHMTPFAGCRASISTHRQIGTLAMSLMPINDIFVWKPCLQNLWYANTAKLNTVSPVDGTYNKNLKCVQNAAFIPASRNR